MPEYIKLRRTAPMKVQGVLRDIQSGKQQIEKVFKTKRTVYVITNASTRGLEVGMLRSEDESFLDDLHTMTPARLRVTGGGLILQGPGGHKLREVADWIDLSDPEMDLVLEGYYTIVPKLHGVNIDL